MAKCFYQKDLSKTMLLKRKKERIDIEEEKEIVLTEISTGPTCLQNDII